MLWYRNVYLDGNRQIVGARHWARLNLELEATHFEFALKRRRILVIVERIKAS